MDAMKSKVNSIAGLALLGILNARIAVAGIINENFSDDVRNETGIGANEQTPIDITITSISLFLSLLGLIALVIIIYAGFRWMTAGGNEEQITEAKGLLKGAVIGVAIILFSYTIAQFIFSSIESATGQGSIVVN